MNCPVCRKPLLVVERQGIEIDYCPACKGFWFDAGEIGLLPEALGVSLDLQDPATLPVVETREKMIACPRCRKRMDKVTLGAGSSLILDRCPRGEGLWFDAGELAAFLKANAGSGEGEGLKSVRFLGETLSLE